MLEQQMIGRMAFVWLVLLGFAVAGRAAAQVPTERPDRFALRYWVGVGFGGSKDLQSAMIAAGFDDPEACFLFCGERRAQPRPVSRDESIPWMVEAAYRRSRRSDLAVQISRRVVVTRGYRDPNEPLGVVSRVNTIAATYGYFLGPLRAHGGPALHQFTWWLGEGPFAGYRHGSSAGLVAGVGVSTPKFWKVLTLELKGQYRYIRKVEVGPYSEFDFPAVSADYSDFFLGFGTGVRF